MVLHKYKDSSNVMICIFNVYHTIIMYNTHILTSNDIYSVLVSFQGSEFINTDFRVEV